MSHQFLLHFHRSAGLVQPLIGPGNFVPIEVLVFGEI